MPTSPLSDELVALADIIFVLERAHQRKLQTKHRGALGATRVVVLGIPDDYGVMDPALLALLQAKMRRLLLTP